MNGTSMLSRIKPFASVFLVVIGLTLVAVGVAMIYLPAGVIVGGFGLFALEWFITDRR